MAAAAAGKRATFIGSFSLHRRVRVRIGVRVSSSIRIRPNLRLSAGSETGETGQTLGRSSMRAARLNLFELAQL